ncbi:hypothetical protein HGP28_16090 [Vibrio sp. SM6]|uniref:Uncharacterized protein n=1 Tax=Vibrio agarilyticus TaxID=2726741 RepID=A0A7X8TTM3_9VIBR|nr:hypothetical protein [Vibrio agarilyticus]NLS14401.1 hypothetical protein [Vibrio agarilyticus]
MKKSVLITPIFFSLLSTSVLAVTEDFDYAGTETVITAVGEIPLVCGITDPTKVGAAAGDIEFALLEQGASVPASDDLYVLSVRSNSVSPVTYDIEYNSTTLVKASDSSAAVAGTDAYFTLDGTTKLLAADNPMTKVADGYSANIFAVTADSFASYAKKPSARLVGTITVNCPDS